MNPDLIPRPGILFHLTPMNTPGEFAVNLDTYGCGYAIGRVTRRHDGTWQVFHGPDTCGYAETPERAMMACVRAYLNGPDAQRIWGTGLTPENPAPDGPAPAGHALRDEDQGGVPPEPETGPPSAGDLEEMLLGSRCEATDGCDVEPDGTCEHGHQSWLLHLGLI